MSMQSDSDKLLPTDEPAVFTLSPYYAVGTLQGAEDIKAHSLGRPGHWQGEREYHVTRENIQKGSGQGSQVIKGAGHGRRHQRASREG